MTTLETFLAEVKERMANNVRFEPFYSDLAKLVAVVEEYRRALTEIAEMGEWRAHSALARAEEIVRET